jgi:thioredoxin 1
MTFERSHAKVEPPRADIDALTGPALLEFGTPWCGWCRAAQPAIAAALGAHPGVRHVKVEDGSGKPLGRSFGVKLWPTLVFLEDGREVARLVRPGDADAIGQALDSIDQSDRGDLGDPGKRASS